MPVSEHTPKPDPAKGWELLNEAAAAIPDNRRGEFIAALRFAEGMFTSGFMSEEQYRHAISEAASWCKV